MARVNIPAAMRSLTGGESSVEVAGSTVGEVVTALEERFPGPSARLTQEGPAGPRLRAGLTIFVDGEMPLGGLKARVGPESEVYFSPAIAGGMDPDRPF